GYTPSKREYFYGFKLNTLMGSDGLIREVCLLEGSRHDIEGLSEMSFYGVGDREVIGDKAYRNYQMEDVLWEEGIRLSPLRTKKERRYEGEWVEYVKRVYRRFAESVFSVLRRFLGLRPYSVSLSGLFVKIYMAVISYNLHRLWSAGML
ncbi:MAG: transposase, partial [Aquificaceae bacterium]